MGLASRNSRGIKAISAEVKSLTADVEALTAAQARTNKKFVLLLNQRNGDGHKNGRK